MAEVGEDVAQSFVEQLARRAVDGAGPLRSARKIAADALSAEGDE